MIESSLEIVILASTQERGTIAHRKMEKRFLNSVMQEKLVFAVKVIGETNTESGNTVWLDESFFEEGEPWSI